MLFKSRDTLGQAVEALKDTGFPLCLPEIGKELRK
jgi:hypothetical protein